MLFVIPREDDDTPRRRETFDEGAEDAVCFGYRRGSGHAYEEGYFWGEQASLAADRYAGEPEPTAEELCGAYGHGVPAPLDEMLDAMSRRIPISCMCGVRWFCREELCDGIDSPDPED